MAGLLRRSRLVLEGSRLLGSHLRLAQDVPVFAMYQAASFTAASPGKAVRARKKSQDQKAGSETLVGDVPGGGKLGDGSSTPDKPRRSPSAYSHFQKEKFAELKSSSSDKINVGKVAKDIAAQWKKMSEAEKKPYLASAVASKLAHPPSTKSPKPPSKINGYRLFVKENFESVKARNPTVGVKEVMTAMGHEWKAKAQADKDTYNAKAADYNRTLSES